MEILNGEFLEELKQCMIIVIRRGVVVHGAVPIVTVRKADASEVILCGELMIDYVDWLIWFNVVWTEKV